jgi:hypothetical protein
MSNRSGLRRVFHLALGATLLTLLGATFAFAQPGPDSSAASHLSAPAPGAPAVGIPAPADTANTELSPPTKKTEPDGGWPRMITTNSGGTMILYQPQILSWDRQRTLVAMGAISYAPKGSTNPKMGTVKLTSPTSVATEERMVNLERIAIDEINFPSLDKAEAQEVATEVQKSLPKANLVIALDRVLAAVDKSSITAKGIKINTDPPPIFVSTKPAILVQTDVTPIFSPVEGTNLKYVLNTNWDLFQDTKTNLFYVRNDNYWLQSGNLLKDWEPVDKLPEDFKKLPANDSWKDARDNIPGKKISKGKMPVVFFSDRPAEMILIDGKPKTKPISKDSNLLWVQNTECDLFQMKKADYYYLVSGRWFKAKTLDGPWTFATPELPPEFSQIPRDHERARVLSSVPGTEEAAEAVLLASIPKTARVDKKNLKAPSVTYDGDPNFQPIEGTQLYYSVNSPDDVIKFGDVYYLCFQGMWFKSGNANGPWELTTDVPKEIYSIPADSPVHNVTYVTVIDDDPDYPSYGYTAGYVGFSIAFGCAMWGGGWYYPPYYHGGMYYPRPVCYGGGAYYNPRTGAYGYSQHAYGPYGGVSRGAAYNPRTGTYARGGMAYGVGGASGYAQAYNPRTGNGMSTRQGSNVYGSWGSSTVKAGDSWAKTQRVTDNHGNTRWSAQGSGGGSAKGWNTANGSGFVGQKNGDVYAGRDGNVYRKGDNGWQQWDNGGPGAGNGGWNNVNTPGNQPSNRPGAGGSGTADRPSTRPSNPSAGTRPAQQPRTYDSNTASQLNRDAQARSRGNTQTRSYGGSSYGGSRGGGGMRGGGGGGRRR